LPLTPTAAPLRYFEGRARTVQMAVQGRFRRPLRMDEVFTGEALDRPCACLPHPLLCAGVLGVWADPPPGDPWGGGACVVVD